jgi:hypothetical protein
VRVEEFKKAMDRRPFQPFIIRTSDGREIRVNHPGAVAWINDEARTVICAHPDGGWDLIEISLVTSLGYPAPVAPAERPATNDGG